MSPSLMVPSNSRSESTTRAIPLLLRSMHAITSRSVGSGVTKYDSILDIALDLNFSAAFASSMSCIGSGRFIGDSELECPTPRLQNAEHADWTKPSCRGQPALL